MMGSAAMIGAVVARDEAAPRERCVGGVEGLTSEQVQAAMPAILDAVWMTYGGTGLPCRKMDCQRDRENRRSYKGGNPFQSLTRKFPLS